MKRIAHIENDMTEKFGIPRQSGLVSEVISVIVFEPEYRNPDSLRGLEGYTHLWIIWQFDRSDDQTWSPTVRPPKLGGNTRMGVFATRSPNRPNPLGLSCVAIDRIETSSDRGPLIYVSGADLRSGTAILDIKPYLPYTDAHPEASGGFTDGYDLREMEIKDPNGCLDTLEAGERAAICALLRQDPRPGYHDDPGRKYGMKYGSYDVRFTIDGSDIIISDIVTWTTPD